MCFGRPCDLHQEKQFCLCDTWYLSLCVDDCLVCTFIPSCIPDSHPHTITSAKCHINTVVSPDDGHSRPKHVEIDILRINILIINCAPSWLYLQDYTGMHGQQNIKLGNVSLQIAVKSNCVPHIISFFS